MPLNIIIKRRKENLLPSNAIPGTKAEWLHCDFTIICKPRITEMTFRNELVSVDKVGVGMVGGELVDGDNSLHKA